jgi:uncharacterized protein
MKKVYVDFDDVLCETARTIMRVAAERFGRQVPFEQIHFFDLSRSFSLSRAQHDELMHYVHAPDVLLAMAPIPGAGDTLRDWASAGAQVVVVTGRPPSTAPVCRAWLARHAMPYAALVFVDKYGRSHPPVTDEPVLTLDALTRETFDLAVEDSPEMAAFVARAMNCRVILFDRPWNHSLQEDAPGLDGRLVRCRGWSAVAARFSAISP